MNSLTSLLNKIQNPYFAVFTWIIIFHAGGILYAQEIGSKSDSHDYLSILKDYQRTENIELRTNLIYWATTTPNFSLEFRLNNKISLSTTIGYNAWNFKNGVNIDGEEINPKIHHWLVMPELKYWMNNTFRGHYFGLHALGSQFNIGGLKFPKFMEDTRYEGWSAGACVSYGYKWRFGKNWGLEASIGGGYLYFDYKKIECQNCGKRKGRYRRNYFGPTKASLSLSFFFGESKKIITRIDTVYVPVELPCYNSEMQETETDGINFSNEPQECMTSVNLHLNYKVGDSHILPGYSDNAAELRKLNELLRPFYSPGSSTEITDIVITGYASPEAPEDYNHKLSLKRAEEMRDYIYSRYNIPYSVSVSTEGKGEDWQGLEDMIKNHAEVQDYDNALQAIGNIQEPALKEKALKKLNDGKLYLHLLDEVFPELRRIEVKVFYKTIERELAK